ncbi:hypothetical protein ARMGADRAFT_1086903 [Armillaria gallica]|uniref:CCHC-type domain-containing protein n=1 Tax=Armillaria gallica TaxID=47427 RepID=A0A2H3D5T8_ARMGA|nr:hypothetical protein ARMGADRAFT_1086903 [Armillaria gallica]
MTRKLDDYTITQRFVTGLPPDMRGAVFDNRLNVEVNMLEEFVESAKVFEVTECSKKEYGPSAQLQPSPGANNPTPVQRPGYNNDAPKARLPRPTNLSNIKCFRCGEMGHYSSFHDKDTNPCIRAAHTTISDDIHEDGDDDDSIMENGPSEGEPENFKSAAWQEVEFEEYGEGYESRGHDDQEFMGMTHITDTPDPYDGSSKLNSDSENEWSSDEPDSSEYRVRYLTT